MAQRLDWIAIDQIAAGSCRLEFCFAKEGPMFTLDKADRWARNMSEMMDRLGLDADLLPQCDAVRASAR